jgi:hypothetical protein
MSLEIQRPKGVTIFLILGLLDAFVMAIFVVLFFGSPDFYFELFDPEAEIGQEFAIIKYNEHMLELGIFVIVVDTMMIAGLLSKKQLGRNIVIGGAIVGILLNAVTFGIPGLASNSILVWYMYRKNTREYFSH